MTKRGGEASHLIMSDHEPEMLRKLMWSNTNAQEDARSRRTAHRPDTQKRQ